MVGVLEILDPCDVVEVGLSGSMHELCRGFLFENNVVTNKTNIGYLVDGNSCIFC